MSAATEQVSGIPVLEEKMLIELKAGNTYEALQYVQSFIARKKKGLTPNLVSEMVFHAAKLLFDYEAAAYAGTLLLWFIDGGAGEDNGFHVERGALLDGSYCDLQRLTQLLSANPQPKAAAALDVIQKNILSLIETLPNIGSAPLELRVREFETIASELFEFSANWRMAYKFRLRLRDMKLLAKTVDLWASDAYPTERPLFFTRAIWHILVGEQPGLALDLVQAANAFVVEADHPAMAAWHLTQIICELIDLPGNPNVNKAVIFEQLSKKYYPIIAKLDDKLLPLLTRIGMQSFGVKPPPGASALNPLAMLEALSGGKKATDGSLDMSNIMSMISNMQQAGGKRK